MGEHVQPYAQSNPPRSLPVAPAPDVPYFTPLQENPAGAALTTGQTAKSLPLLFQPLKIRDLTFHNRIVVSPMCTYSADNGHLTDWHLVHLGSMAMRGPGLTFIEATAVQFNGRISPQDSGLWQDSQIEPIRRVAEFLHSQSQLVAIQLAHAGRKASMLAPWLNSKFDKPREQHAISEHGGWPDEVVGPSPLSWDEDRGGFIKPREMSVDEIKQLVKDFGAAAKRAVAAGVDVVEIHGAHGYLLCEFLSPTSNKRTDQYGGSYENRTRIIREVITEVRASIPRGMPLFLRLSANEWLPEGTAQLNVHETIRFAKELPTLGVDLLDVSSAGNSSKQNIKLYDRYQIDLAKEIRKAIVKPGEKEGDRVLVGAVGRVMEADFARDILEEGDADMVFVARQFLREPEWVLRVAHKLDVRVGWPQQYHRALWSPKTKI